MSFIFVTPQVTLARNAGALYNYGLGTETMASLVSTPDLNGLLNSVYVNSIGSTATSQVAKVFVQNLGITGSAATTAEAYVVAQLNPVAVAGRGKVINDILIAFSGLTGDATFGAFATAWNTKVAAAVAYAATPGTRDGTWAVATSAGAVQTFALTAGAASTEEGGIATFQLTLDKAPTTAVTVNYATAPGTASVNDYVSAAGTVTFAAGQTTAFVYVSTVEDSTFEPDETFTVSFSGSSLTGPVSATGTIINDDVDTANQPRTFTLTAGVDNVTGTSSGDTFDGSVNANGTATLTSVDQIDGAGGTDSLIAGLAAGTIAPTLRNIESAEFIAAGGSVIDLINTTGMNSVLVRNSNGLLTLNNIASTTSPAITLRDQSADLTLNFGNGALAGASSLTVSLSGAQADATGGAILAITQQAGTDITGLESITIASGGSGANFLDAVTSVNASGTSTVTSVTVTGAQRLTVANAFNASVRTVDAAGLTGATGLSAGFGATLAVTVTGSDGNDALTFAANAGNSSISAGAGNDTITIADFNTADSIAGGDGTADRLSISAGNAEAIAAALTNTTGFEQLSLNTSGTGGSSINATRFGTIDTVRLDAGTNGPYGVTMKEGAVTLGVGNAGAGQLGGALTVTDTGVATTDVLNLTNRVSSAALNVFADANNIPQDITSAGYETVNLSTGATTTAGPQATGVITLNNDVLSAANTLNISGVNSITVNRVDSNSSGQLTIDASGLTGTAALTMSNAPLYTVATGTAAITGSANADSLIGLQLTATTIAGGAGNDTITGGAGADNISGDAGNDNITGNGGNDVVTGGDGNDTINVSTAAGVVNVSGGAGNDTVTMGGFLSATDTVDGGDGTDTLSITAAATAALASGVTGFETLTIAASLADGIAAGVAGQRMEQFISNTTFTRINFGAFANAVTNAGLNVATIGLGNSGSVALSMARLVDTSSNALTIVGTNTATGPVGTATSLTINDEEAVTVNTGTSANASNFTFAALNASDLTSLTVTGAGSFGITAAIGGAANLATFNALGNSGTVSVDASTSTANMTATGSFTAANTITGGTGADTLTGGVAADSLTGGNGADVIDGGAGNDTLLGGLGADSIRGDIGNDTITGGVGNDTLVGGDGADQFVFETASNGVDAITGFVTGTDKLNDSVARTTDVTVITAGAQGAMTDASVHYISMNGAAANLTTGGTATLSGADLTATTLTNLAGYLSERFTTTASVTDSTLVINWTAGGSTTTYVYDYTASSAANSTVDANELTLIGIVDRGTSVLVAGDVL